MVLHSANSTTESRIGGFLVRAWMILLLLVTGCDEPTAKFVPSVVDSRAALSAAMTAWKSGSPPGPVPDISPAVHLTDSHRKQGQILEDFEILGEVPGNAPRCFAVRLKLANPSADERARFVVFGIDPLWVFRHEDYDLLMHWEHPMEEKESESAAADAPQEEAKGGN
jgi:hypothetical protein